MNDMLSPPPDYIPHRCVERTDDGRELALKCLDDLRGLKAYILLGDIGAGKTTFFQREEAEAGGKFLPVNEFLDLNQKYAPDFWPQPLLIDGLDETSNSISRVRGKLDALGNPRVRLSCRAANWGGKRNTDAIRALYPDVRIFHLEPFSDSERRLFLKLRGVADIDGMLAVGEWLGGNPLLLNILADVWDGGEIKNKKVFYDAWCRKLAQEHDSNRTDTVRESGGVTPSPEQLMHVAGEMCAAILRSDKAGFAEKAQGRYAGIDELLHKDEDGTLPRKVLTSKLFMSQKDGGCIPRHPNIAEFLGGRHLARLVDDKNVKMSPARAGGLCGSTDDGVVSNLREMHAWLATCAKTPAPFLKTDAFGVASLGGFSNYCSKDQRLFLQYLLEQSEKNRDDYALTSRHYDMLNTLPAVADAVKRELASEKRNHKQQDKAYLLLRIIEKAHSCPPSINEVLMKTLEDGAWYGAVRAKAASVLGKQAQNNPKWGVALRDYAKNMNRKKRLNRDEGLIMSKLLGFLYPKFVPASDIANYLHYPGNMPLGFWYDFHQRSDVTGKDAGEVLDKMGSFITSDFAARLFGKAISYDADPQRVWRWLEAYAAKYKRVPESLKKCIAGDSRLFFGLLDIARKQKRDDVHAFFWFFQELRECADAEEVLDYLWNNHPVDERQNKQTALDYAYRHSGWKWSEAKQKVNSRIGEDSSGRDAHRDFRSGLAKSLKQHAPHKREWRMQDRQRKDEEYAQTRKYWAYVRENIPKIKSGQNIWLLSEFAFYSITKGDDWEELLQYVDEASIRNGCAAAIRSGNAKMSPQDVFDKARANTHDGWEFIYRLGMDVIYQRAPDDLLTLSCDTVRRAVAFAVVGSGGDWMNYLKANRRELVAQTVKPLFDDGFDGITNFDSWVEENGDMFTSQERRKLLCALMHNAKGEDVFRAMLRISVKQQDVWLSELIDEQMRASLPLPQCGFLAAAGFSSADKLEERADAARALMPEEKFRNAFFSFFGEEELHSFFAHRQGLFVGLFAPFVKTRQPSAGFSVVSVDSPMRQADMVRQLIVGLGEKGAVKELNGLALAAKAETQSHDSCWEYWIPELEYAQERAVIYDRDSHYSPLSVAEVVASLRGDAPANADDLRDMLMEVLDNLRENKYCEGNPNNLRKQYWNTATAGKGGTQIQPKAKRENECRGFLANEIEHGLPQSCRVDTEASSARERRADLLVSSGEFEVPVEIKRANNRELWSGIEDQLADYVRRPKAHGCGVYLVLWFDTCKNPPSDFPCPKPKNPEELKLALTEFAKQGGHDGIRVFVMDLSL